METMIIQRRSVKVDLGKSPIIPLKWREKKCRLPRRFKKKLKKEGRYFASAGFVLVAPVLTDKQRQDLQEQLEKDTQSWLLNFNK